MKTATKITRWTNLDRRCHTGRFRADEYQRTTLKRAPWLEGQRLIDAVIGPSDSETLLDQVVWATLMPDIPEELFTGRTSIHPSSRSNNNFHDVQNTRGICHSK